MTAPAARPIPALAKPRTGRLPVVAEQVMSNGLRVLVVRRAGVPLVELRLRIPFARRGGKDDTAAVARAQLLSDTLLSGTDRRSATDIAALLQGLGGQLNVGVDPDRLSLSGSVLSSGFGKILGLLGELLTSASYPKKEVVGERDRLVTMLAMYRSQAGVIAREALLGRLYGDHPYAREVPAAGDVADVKPNHLRALHAKRVSPTGAVLVVVGDVQPAKAFAEVERTLGGWSGTGAAKSAPSAAAPVPGGVLLVDRPGSVQSTLRWARFAPSRTDPGYPALALANMVFGGYFSSRWSANIREDKGYTYGAQSGFEHPVAGTRLVLGSDVATEVTAPAVLESLYELGRVATVAVAQDELDQARRYAIGSLQVGIASQAGLASLVAMLDGAGLGVDYLRDYPKALQAVTVDDALAAAATYLRPQDLTAVVVGDASRVHEPLSRLVPVELA